MGNGVSTDQGNLPSYGLRDVSDAADRKQHDWSQLAEAPTIEQPSSALWSPRNSYISNRFSMILWSHNNFLSQHALPVRFWRDRKLILRLPIGLRAIAGGLSTSVSGSVILTSRELWAEPLPRPVEGEFPMVEREFVSARGCTDQNWGVLGKTGGRTHFDLVRMSNSSGRLPIRLRK